MNGYIRGVILFGFVVDILLILGTNRLLGYPVKMRRTLLAAGFSGFYRGVCMIRSFRFLAHPLWRLVSLGIMGWIAFGMDITAMKRGAVLILLSLALSGAAAGAHKGTAMGVVISGSIVWALCIVGFHGGGYGRRFLPIEISYRGKHISLIALQDSGNSLRDPISGEKVLVIDAAAAESLTGLRKEELSAPIQTLAQGHYPAMKLIPYHTIGTEHGLLLAMRFSDVQIGREHRSAIVAFSAEEIGRGEGYRALCA